MRRPWRKYWWTLFIALFAGLGVIWSHVESSNIEVRHLYIEESHVGDLHKYISIAQISDLHIRPGDKQVTKIFQILQRLKVDAIVLTGDYVEWNGDYESALNVLARFKADTTVYAVMGDYDYSSSRKSCLFCHELGTGKPTKRHSVKFLRNSCDKVAVGKDTIMICGIDGRQANEPVSPDVVKHLQDTTKGQGQCQLNCVNFL